MKFKLGLFQVLQLILLWIFKSFTMVAAASIYSLKSETFNLDTIEGYTIRILFSLGGLLWILKDLNLILVDEDLSKTEHSTPNSTQSHTGKSKQGSYKVENTTLGDKH